MIGYWGIFLSVVFTAKGCCDITERHVGSGVKAIAMTLDYPVTKGIPIKQIDTHSLHLNGMNALSSVEYSDTQIKKMGCWHSKTFKENT
jgi:hypothetical protein